MPEGPDVRALRWLADHHGSSSRPTSCGDCPFASVVPDFPDWVYCALLDPGATLEVNRADSPRCAGRHWQQRARAELDALTSDNALFAALAHDAREESSMYARGLAEGAAAEREACCKAVCPDCAAGLPAGRNGKGDWWGHQVSPGTWRSCSATRIRRRAEEDGR